MARYYVFDDADSAAEAIAAIDARARELYAAQGYTIDRNGSIIGKRASDRADMPESERVRTWDIPRQRQTDGKIVVAHTETCPAHDVPVDASGTLVWQYVMQDVTAPVEAETAEWHPLVEAP